MCEAHKKDYELVSRGSVLALRDANSFFWDSGTMIFNSISVIHHWVIYPIFMSEYLIYDTSQLLDTGRGIVYFSIPMTNVWLRLD